MLIASTGRSIQVGITGTTPIANVATCWKDKNLSSRIESYGNKEVSISGTELVDVVAAPGQQVVREIVSIFIHNTDDTTTTASVYMTGGDTITPVIAKAALATLESMHYTKERGWHCLDANGAVKTTPHA